jgi:hypothetical protein
MIRKQDLDPRQLSFFDNEDDSEWTKEGYTVIRPPVTVDPKYRSNKPLLTYRIRGYSYHDEPGPLAIVYAVSDRQAKFLYDQHTGNCYKYGREISRIVR